MLDSEMLLRKLFVVVREKGLSQADVARITGFNESTISRWRVRESGDLNHVCTSYRAAGYKLIAVPVEKINVV